MNGAPNTASQTQLWSRRALLRRAGLGAASLSILAACGPAATPAAPTSAPAAAPITPAAAAAPTTAAASSAATPSGTLRYASADFGQESMDPINIASQWGWAMYDELLTFDPQGNVIGSVA